MALWLNAGTRNCWHHNTLVQRLRTSLLADCWEGIRGFAINIAIVLGASANFHPQDVAAGSALVVEGLCKLDWKDEMWSLPTRERDQRGDLEFQARCLIPRR